MASVDIDPNDATDKTPLIPGGGGDDDDNGVVNPIWNNTDLSQQQVTEEEKEEWRRFNSNTAPNTTDPAGGENIQMATKLPPEKQRASGGTADTSFIGEGRRSPLTLYNIARREVETEFPNADFNQLVFRFKEAPRSGGHIIEVRYHNSDKWYPLYTKSPGEDEKTLNAGLPKRIKEALGKSLTDVIKETNAVLQNYQDKEAAQLKELHQAQTRADEAQRLR